MVVKLSFMEVSTEKCLIGFQRIRGLPCSQFEICCSFELSSLIWSVSLLLLSTLPIYHLMHSRVINKDAKNGHGSKPWGCWLQWIPKELHRDISKCLIATMPKQSIKKGGDWNWHPPFHSPQKSMNSHVVPCQKYIFNSRSQPINSVPSCVLSWGCLLNYSGEI